MLAAAVPRYGGAATPISQALPVSAGVRLALPEAYVPLVPPMSHSHSHSPPQDVGLALPFRLFPAVAPVCWDTYTPPFALAAPPSPPLPAPRRAVEERSQARAVLSWVTADGALASTPYSVWEVARLSDPAREELAVRFSDVLPLSPSHLSLLSPAIVAAPGGGFKQFLRTSYRNGQWAAGSYVWAQDLDADFMPSPSSALTSVAMPSSMEIFAGGAEDPRAIIRPTDDALFLFFNAQVKKDAPRSMYMYNTARLGRVRKLWVNNSNVGEMDGATQKNWAPFYHDGAFHVLYSVQPLVVLRCGDDGQCMCVHSDGPSGCEDLRGLAKSERLRLGSPLVELGDSGIFATALHSIIKADEREARKYGYRGHLALLSSSPWGWVAASTELTPPPHVRACANGIAQWFTQGIDFPTSLLLVGERAESILLGAHFHDTESSMQQIVFDAPLVDLVATLCASPYSHTHL